MIETMDVTKSFGGRHTGEPEVEAVNRVTLEIRDQEYSVSSGQMAPGNPR